jgi:iron complex outermembrane receptor protein
MVRVRFVSCPSALLACLLTASPLAAQESPAEEDVVRASDDAFGRRIGVETVGLYSETSVRGFNLESAGNYRIDGHYFVRDATPVNGTIKGTVVRVGANALRYDFPAPSGVYEFQLATADPGFAASFETGYRGGNGGPILEANGSAASGDLGLAGGIQLAPWQKYSDGTDGTYFSLGLVPSWSPGPGVSVKGLFSKSWWEAGSDTLIATDGSHAPPKVRRRVNRGQKWTRFRLDSFVGGLLADAAIGDGFRIGGSMFVSESDRPFSSFNLLALDDPAGTAQATAFLYPEQRSRSWSGEMFAEREFATGPLRHRLLVAVRGRDTKARPDAGETFDLGTTDITGPPLRVAKPEGPLGRAPSRDHVVQKGVGIAYRLSIGSLLELRADAQKVDYRKEVEEPDAPSSESRSTPWLYSGSAALALHDRLTLFASHARGLEDAGSAPANAVNRNAVLPAGLARQTEVGGKYMLGERLALIAGLFDIRKPFPGLRPDGLYTYVGDVRHRGAELSIAGPITPRLNLVAGFSIFEARLSGLLVESGAIGPEPVGTPERLALADLVWQVPWVEGLSVDGGISVRGGVQANRQNSLALPGYEIFSFGLRQSFELDGLPLSLRARVTNIFDRFAWNVTGSELYFHNGPRAYTLTLSGNL